MQEFQRSTEDKSAIDLYYQGIKAEETREKYTRSLRLLLCHILDEILDGTFEERATQLVKRSRSDPDWARDLLISISKKLRDRTVLPEEHNDHLSTQSIPNYFKPVKKLFDMNNVSIPWKRIYATYPEETGSEEETRGWNRDEIKLMIKAAGLRDAATILVLTSSGIRIGGSDFFWGDVTPIYQNPSNKQDDNDDNNGIAPTPSLTFDHVENAKPACARIKIYKGTKYGYSAFITPEAYCTLMDYKKQWTFEVGREPKEDDPVFKMLGSNVEPTDVNTMERRIYKILEKVGLREKLPLGKKRHEVPQTNGFRRFWDKACMGSLTKNSALLSLVQKEYMMGHKGLTKFDKNYYPPRQLELAAQYLSAVPALTISDEFRLQAQLLKIQQERKDEKKTMQGQAQIISEMQKQLEQRDNMFQEMIKRLEERNIVVRKAKNV